MEVLSQTVKNPAIIAFIFKDYIEDRAHFKILAYPLENDVPGNVLNYIYKIIYEREEKVEKIKILFAKDSANLKVVKLKILQSFN